MADLIINDNTPRVPYAVTTVPMGAFDVPFAFFKDTDLEVTKTVAEVDTKLVLGTDYTVAGAMQTVGGVVNMTVPVTNCLITIVRKVPLERTSDYPNVGPFPVSALNNDLDRLVAMVQQVNAVVLRCIRLADSDIFAGAVLPPPSARANKALVFDGSGGVAVSTDDFANIVSQAQTYATQAQNAVTQIQADIDEIKALLQQAGGPDLLPPAVGGSAGKPVISDGDGTFSLGALYAQQDLTNVNNTVFLNKATEAGVVAGGSGGIGSPSYIHNFLGGSY